MRRPLGRLNTVKKSNTVKHAATFSILFAAVLAQAQSPSEVARYAKALYMVSYRSEDEASYVATHKKALEYIHHASRTKLAADLEAVQRRYGLKSSEGVGATYLLALHGIDLDRNLTRLGALKMGTDFEVIEGLPEGLADIALRRRSSRAAEILVAMRTDGHLGEDQAAQIARVFFNSPRLLIGAVATRRSLWKPLIAQLSFGAQDEADDGIARVRRIALRYSKRSKGTERDLFLRLGKLTKDERF